MLSRLFRRLFLDRLQGAFEHGALGFFGDLAGLAEPAAFTGRIDALRHAEWVVYAKPPFGGPEHVMAYLGRYTHRVAIANSRLVSVTDADVAFRWKDYRHHGKSKVMTLSAHEFIRRFLLHTLPDGFHRIRHFGFLANGHRADKLALCRRLLAATAAAETIIAVRACRQPTAGAYDVCPCCGAPMIRLGKLARAMTPSAAFWSDTS